MRVFLGLGVLGGAALALLAGLATATRAMAPIPRLTDAARAIERTRDPSLSIPHPEASDEVSELARTLEGMLHALDEARGETEATLARQRQFVADASHELRTPLTSVLANLELLEMELEGEPREAAASALRSTRRMRRLVADLLLLARADAGRVGAARARRPLRGRRRGGRRARARRRRPPDQRRRAAAAPRSRARATSCTGSTLNLLENALRHTDPGTAVEATVERDNGEVVLSVEDDGPGIPPELRDKVFERFFRGAGDRSGSSGLGLSIVRAVARVPRRHRRAGGAARRPRRALRGALPRARLTARRSAPHAGGSSGRPAADSPGRTAIAAKGHPCPRPPHSSSSSSASARRSTPCRSRAVHEIIRFTEPRSVASEVAGSAA